MDLLVTEVCYKFHGTTESQELPLQSILPMKSSQRTVCAQSEQPGKQEKQEFDGSSAHLEFAPEHQ